MVFLINYIVNIAILFLALPGSKDTIVSLESLMKFAALSLGALGLEAYHFLPRALDDMELPEAGSPPGSKPTIPSRT